MSYGVYTEGGDPELSLGDWSYTYNVRPMLERAGLESLHRIDGLRADIAALVVAAIVTRMDADMPTYRALNPPNGWGDADELLERLRALRDYLAEDGEATVRVV